MTEEFYDKSIETMSLDNLRRRWIKYLNFNLKRAKRNSRFWKTKLKHIDRIKSLEDLKKIPIVTKDELRKYIGGTLVVKREKIIEVHTSSGTTAKPFIAFYTKKDLSISKGILARTWWMQRVRPRDSVYMMVSFGLFTAGLLNMYAIQRIGATVIPAGILPSKKHLEFISVLKPSIWVAVSSYYLRLKEILENEEDNIRIEFPRAIIGGGVPVSEKMRKEIEEAFNTEFFNQYGLAEINTGLAGECYAHNGLHIQADYALPEIVDPKSLESLKEGEKGILVLTTLKRDAQIIFRYLTYDITSITLEKCECGRTLPRLSSIEGRSDEIILAKGIKLDLKYFQEILWELKDTIDPEYWQLKIQTKNGKDHLELYILPKTKEADINYLAEYIKDKVGIKIDQIIVLDSKSIIGMTGKPKHLLDLRKM